MICGESLQDRRKLFWSTQLGACGIEEGCQGQDCWIAGHKVTNPNGGLPSQSDRQRTISTSDYVVGLALNMLLTDARRDDTVCGQVAGSLNGHWSESYIENGSPIGTKFRYAPESRSINDAVRIQVAYVEETLKKLVDYGVARSVEVTHQHIMGAKFRFNITIFGINGESSRVGVSAKREENSWVWQ